jgi:arsenate reductase
MAQGFLKSFDERIMVVSAGTQPGKEVNRNAIYVMAEAGIDISAGTPQSVEKFIGEPWDYVITVCDDANESCPVFVGMVTHRLHMGFEDPSRLQGSEEYVLSEFRRVRDQIKDEFKKFYEKEIKPKLQ